jgi:hypothetical protein
MASRPKRKKAWREQQYKPEFVKKSKQKLGSIHDKPLRKEVGHE